MKKIKRIMKSNEMFLFVIIIFSLIWSSYLILDFDKKEDKPRNILEMDYTKKYCMSIDGLTSFIEEIIFGIVCPSISCFMMIDYIWRMKNERKTKRSSKETS